MSISLPTLRALALCFGTHWTNLRRHIIPRTCTSLFSDHAYVLIYWLIDPCVVWCLFGLHGRLCRPVSVQLNCQRRFLRNLQSLLTLLLSLFSLILVNPVDSSINSVLIGRRRSIIVDRTGAFLTRTPVGMTSFTNGDASKCLPSRFSRGNASVYLHSTWSALLSEITLSQNCLSPTALRRGDRRTRKLLVFHLFPRARPHARTRCITCTDELQMGYSSRPVRNRSRSSSSPSGRWTRWNCVVMSLFLCADHISLLYRRYLCLFVHSGDITLSEMKCETDGDWYSA